MCNAQEKIAVIEEFSLGNESLAKRFFAKDAFAVTRSKNVDKDFEYYPLEGPAARWGENKKEGH